MKTRFYFTCALLFFSASLFAQNEKYVQTMTSSIAALNQLDKSKPDQKTLQEIANQFDKIAAAEPKEWLPRYYAGNCYILLGFSGKDLTEKDQFLDKAENILKSSETLAGKPNDEIMVLIAYLAQGRLAADATNRWEEYGAQFTDFLTSAKAINPENPRIYYLEGANVFCTPEEYGGGKKAAKPYLDNAVRKFSTFKPETSIHPNWGKFDTDWMASQSK